MSVHNGNGVMVDFINNMMALTFNTIL